MIENVKLRADMMGCISNVSTMAVQLRIMLREDFQGMSGNHHYQWLSQTAEMFDLEKDHYEQIPLFLTRMINIQIANLISCLEIQLALNRANEADRKKEESWYYQGSPEDPTQPQPEDTVSLDDWNHDIQQGNL